MPANLENSAMATGLKTSVFIPIPKKVNAKECSNYRTIPLIRRKWQPTPVFLPGESQGRGSPVGCSPWGHKESDTTEQLHFNYSKKNIYFCFIDYANAFDCVDHNKLWKILKEMGIPDHLTFLLRNLNAGQEATVLTRHGTTGSK